MNANVPTFKDGRTIPSCFEVYILIRYYKKYELYSKFKQEHPFLYNDKYISMLNSYKLTVGERKCDAIL